MHAMHKIQYHSDTLTCGWAQAICFFFSFSSWGSVFCFTPPLLFQDSSLPLCKVVSQCMSRIKEKQLRLAIEARTTLCVSLSVRAIWGWGCRYPTLSSLIYDLELKLSFKLSVLAVEILSDTIISSSWLMSQAIEWKLEVNYDSSNSKKTLMVW